MEKRFRERTLGISVFSDWEDEKEPSKKTDGKWSSSASDREWYSRNQEKKCFEKEGVINDAKCSEGSRRRRTEN